MDIHKEIFSLKKKVKELESEVEELRNEQEEIAKDTVHTMIDEEQIRLGADNDGSVRIISETNIERDDYED